MAHFHYSPIENKAHIIEKDKNFYQPDQNQTEQDGKSALNEELILEIRSMILEEYDSEYGGFGSGPKFPHAEVLGFLLDEYHRTGNEDLAEMLHKTLINMVGGGMFDREMGGFFRYSTTQDWGIPRYEKMVEDNVKLLGIYLKAFQIFNDGKYKEVVLDTIMYLTDWMVDRERGLFYGSQHADVAYYEKTREERDKLKEPYIDKTIYTSWNGLGISAFLQCFAVLDALKCREIALKGLDFLLQYCYKPGEGMYHYYLDGQGHNTCLLEDQLSVVNALLDAYQITHLKKYVTKARELVDLVTERFYDSEHGGFYIDLSTLDRRALLDKPLTINSCVAAMLLRLGRITADEKYNRLALETLQINRGLYRGYGLFAAAFGSAVSAYIHGFTHITAH